MSKEVTKKILSRDETQNFHSSFVKTGFICVTTVPLKVPPPTTATVYVRTETLTGTRLVDNGSPRLSPRIYYSSNFHVFLTFSSSLNFPNPPKKKIILNPPTTKTLPSSQQQRKDIHSFISGHLEGTKRKSSCTLLWGESLHTHTEQ